MPSLSLKPTAINECWDCEACGDCCRGAMVRLDEDDMRRLQEQDWKNHEDFRGVPIIEKKGLLRRELYLAHRKDGNCVFLMEDGRCRIHAEYGEPAKPLICRLAPYQIVPTGSEAFITLRRYCPAAARDAGRPISEKVKEIRQLARERGLSAPAVPPPISDRTRRPWKDFLRVAETLQQIMLDERFPPVRRLTQGLVVCELLGRSRLSGFDSAKLAELLELLHEAADDECKPLFADRRAPNRTAGLLFRQAALQYIRLHPKFIITGSLGERMRLLRTSLVFARGKGRIPKIHPDFPETDFETLDEPMGNLAPEVLKPITRWFEAMAASKQYALMGRQGWPLVDTFRALTLAYPIAMWMLRFTTTGREATVDDAIDVVRALDRGQGFAPLCGGRHRGRLRSLSRIGQLGTVVVWYAR